MLPPLRESMVVSERPRILAADPVDLHLHTLASDGFWTPEALIDVLANRGFRVAAVADHDNQRSVADAMRFGAERGVIVVPAVEMTTSWNNRQVHLLVYGLEPGLSDPAAAVWNQTLVDIDALMQERASDAVERFRTNGKELPSLEEILNGRVLWPFHVLSAAIKDGHAKNLKESAELLVKLGGDFNGDLPLDRVVDAAHQAGGITVVAHPGRGDSVGLVTEADLQKMLPEIPADGLEAHYRSYSDTDTALYRRLADSMNLVTSTGSDSHGPGQPVDPLAFRAAWSKDLLEMLGIDVVGDSADELEWREGMSPIVPSRKEKKSTGKAKKGEKQTS
jgi:predicted metal-dependent phosphoesterase TrpH